MLIAEIFHSLQGEGIHVGMPSVFVRTSGCNLRCTWCDTPYASWKAEGDSLSVDDIVGQVDEWPGTRHVVVTGGEPLIAPDMDRLVGRLRDQGRTVTIETAGTVYLADVAPDLFSISPKLANSVPGPDQPRERQIHQRQNRLSALPDYIASGCDCQFKFVIQTDDDAGEALDLIDLLKLPRHRVFLMPEGASPRQVQARAAAVADICLREGLRYSGRLHLDLWGGQRGR